MSDRREIDWEGIEREFRAGQLSIREIGRRFGVTDTAIRKRAAAEGWQRALADKVRRAVAEKLVREPSSQKQRAPDAEVIETAAVRGFMVVTSHRRDLEQLHGLKRILAARLASILDGVAPDGPCLGDKESPGDLLEKLSRVTSRLIPLERQAHNLDSAPDDPVTVKVDADAAFVDLVGALDSVARSRASGAGGKSAVDRKGEA